MGRAGGAPLRFTARGAAPRHRSRPGEPSTRGAALLHRSRPAIGTRSGLFGAAHEFSSAAPLARAGGRLRGVRAAPRFLAAIRFAAPSPLARRLGRAAPLAALLVLFIGCSDENPRTLEDYLGRVTWFPTMRHQPSVEPYEEAPRMPPEGALPVDGSPALTLVEAERITESPIPATEASLARGQAQYDIFCAVCHGPDGSGGGNVATQTGFPAGLIASLVSERARGLTDGYLYGMVANGRGLMPAYRRIPEPDRWHIVNYVRALQSKASGAEQAASATNGGVPERGRTVDAGSAAGAGSARDTGAPEQGRARDAAEPNS